MSAFHDNALMGASGQQGYKISRSVRLRSSASAYFNRTFGSGSRTTWTWSCWIKRGAVGVVYPTTNYAQTLFGLNDSDKLYFYEDALWLYLGTGATYVAQPTDKFRDPSAWYHVVVVLDTTNATSADRIRMYVNNRRITISQTMPTQNWASSNFNSAVIHNIGKADNSNLYYLDGYLTEIQLIDGQALTPSSFGETDTTTGVWKPKKYTGTYGTNGFYLNFSDNSGATATTIGKDYSGNGNNWTPNNISVTAGVTYDSMVDSPTMGATSSNYAVLNSVGVGVGTIADANLKLTATASAYQSRATTIGVTSGKWYWEVAIVSGGNYQLLGIDSPSRSYVSGGYVGDATSGRGWSNAANTYIGGSPTSYGATYTTNDVLGFALDMDAGTLVCYKNGVSQGTAFSGITGEQAPAFSVYTSGVSIAPNFGQRPFSYTPPTGFVALNTQNLPAPTISNGAQYMAATLYTGNGSSQTVTNAVNGVSFTPDFVWNKGRSVAYNNNLVDVIRGNSNVLFSNTTDAEQNPGAQLDITTNGFISTYRSANLANNQSGATYVGWQWKGGGTAVSNTDGTITSSVSANPTAGFSVVTYTGTGANATVGHGLGVAPAMMIMKPRNSADNWPVWCNSFAVNEYVYLNLTTAKTSLSTFMNSTLPTSTVFSVGTWANVNTSAQTMVAYCFAEVAGYSKFGSYTGNGSADGPFVYLGFRPRWLMIKRSSTASVTYGWQMYDTSRQPANTASSDPNLWADTSAAEGTGNYTFDLLSNGFKIRSSGVNENASGNTYIYMAFAENPFKLSLAR